MNPKTVFQPLSLASAVVLSSALVLASPASANQWPAEGGVALNGTNLTYYAQPDQGQCLAACENNGNCKGATWIQGGTYASSKVGMCYLLSAVTGRVAARGHVSLVKTALQPPRPPPPPPATTGATWFTKSDSNTPNGKRLSFVCPAITAAGYHSIWGTDVYTYDSGICMAGVHVGVITRDRGGLVTIEMRAGQGAYPATTRNGVASQGYGAYDKSFAVIR